MEKVRIAVMILSLLLSLGAIIISILGIYWQEEYLEKEYIHKLDIQNKANNVEIQQICKSPYE